MTAIYFAYKHLGKDSGTMATIAFLLGVLWGVVLS